MRCSCGGKLYVADVRPCKEDGVFQRRKYECRKCGFTVSVAEVDEREYHEMQKKVTELEIKLYAIRKAVME